MAQRRPLRRHPVAVPSSLRAVVRARRAGWRVCLAPGGVRGLLAPVAWSLVMVLAVVLGAVGLAVAAAPFVAFVMDVAARDASDAVGAAFVMIVMPIMGGLIGYGAVRLGRPAWGFAVAAHRVDIRPAAVPAQIVVAGWVRGPVIEIADLSWVLVRERQSGLELVLCTGDRTVVCPATVRSPLLRVNPQLLAGWLGQALAPAEVPVAHYNSVLDPALARDGWLEAPDVARIWQVPAQDVPAVAARYEVRTAGKHGEPRFATDDVEWCAQWAGTMSAAQHDEPSP
jgi:hypothetical protein